MKGKVQVRGGEEHEGIDTDTPYKFSTLSRLSSLHFALQSLLKIRHRSGKSQQIQSHVFHSPRTFVAGGTPCPGSSGATRPWCGFTVWMCQSHRCRDCSGGFGSRSDRHQRGRQDSTTSDPGAEPGLRSCLGPRIRLRCRARSQRYVSPRTWVYQCRVLYQLVRLIPLPPLIHH